MRRGPPIKTLACPALGGAVRLGRPAACPAGEGVARAEAMRPAWGVESSRLGAFQMGDRAVWGRGASVSIVCPRRKSFGRNTWSHSEAADG